MSLTPSRRRATMFVLFGIPGIALASWVTRTPDIRDLLGASTQDMGFVLFGLSVGSMLGVLSSARLIARFGTRPVIVIGLLVALAGLPVIGVGALLGLAPLVAAGLFLFGLGLGGADVAMNVEGADVERIAGRALLPAMHGFFSLGTLIGALAGIWFTAAAVPVLVHLAGVAVVGVIGLVWVAPGLVRGLGRADASAEVVASGQSRALWKDRGLLLIGGIVLALALAEGSANDWLPLLMVDGHGFDPASGSFVYALFAAAMTAGRFGGTPFIVRYGRRMVLAVSAGLGAIGLALVVFVDNPIIAAASVVLWGVGASLGFPVAVSMAGDSGPDPAARVGMVATLGYVAFLVGPPVLGFVGEHVGLRLAMLIVLALVTVAVVLALRTKDQVPTSAD